MRFSFNFSIVAPNHPILISGTADNLDDAKFMFKAGIRLYARDANLNKETLKKLLKMSKFVEPEIQEEHEWSIELLCKDELEQDFR